MPAEQIQGNIGPAEDIEVVVKVELNSKLEAGAKLKIAGLNPVTSAGNGCSVGKPGIGAPIVHMEAYCQRDSEETAVIQVDYRSQEGIHPKQGMRHRIDGGISHYIRSKEKVVIQGKADLSAKVKEHGNADCGIRCYYLVFVNQASLVELVIEGAVGPVYWNTNGNFQIKALRLWLVSCISILSKAETCNQD